MAATQVGTSGLTVAGQTALAAVFIDLPADVIVESCNVNLGGSPEFEDVFDALGAHHTRFTYNGAGSVAFTGGGTAEPLPGTLMTGASSGAAAYLLAVQVDSGTWAGGTAAGTMTLSGLAGGTAFTGEDLNATVVTVQANIATLSGALSIIGMHTATIVLVGKAYTTAAGGVDGITATEQYYVESVSEETSKGPVRTTINVTLIPTEIV